MGHVRSYLTSRVLATGAAVLLLGSGAAIAADGVATSTETEEEPIVVSEEVEATLDVEDEVEDDGDDEVEVDSEGSANDSEETVEADLVPPEGPEDEERSDRAREVHDALTAGQDVREPGPGFGAAVSANARDRNGPPDHAGGPPDLGDRPPAHAQDKDRDGPPAHAQDEDRDGPPAHAPARGRRAQSGD